MTAGASNNCIICVLQHIDEIIEPLEPPSDMRVGCIKVPSFLPCSVKL